MPFSDLKMTESSKLDNKTARFGAEEILDPAAAAAGKAMISLMTGFPWVEQTIEILSSLSLICLMYRS